MLVEYFLRAGYYETAVKCARHSNIEVRPADPVVVATLGGGGRACQKLTSALSIQKHWILKF